MRGCVLRFVDWAFHWGCVVVCLVYVGWWFLVVLLRYWWGGVGWYCPLSRFFGGTLMFSSTMGVLVLYCVCILMLLWGDGVVRSF